MTITQQNNGLRKAKHADITAIRQLLSHYALMGSLLPRTEQDVTENIDNFWVIESDNKVVACGSLEYFSTELAEIRSLMVSPILKRSGYGRLIVEKIIATAQKNKTKKLMALTYVPDFFIKLGFNVVNKNIFPEKVWGICVNCYKFNNCDEIAVLLKLSDTNI